MIEKKQYRLNSGQYLQLMVLSFLFFLVSGNLFAQKPLSSAQIKDGIEKLNVFGSVLYIAAHPDDENTQLIAYLAGHRQYDTTYLSLTRGDGGQNLIGSDLREKLGLIRTHELLAARAIDGGQQRFTRAVDFGYSKSPEEAFQFWGRETVLEDVVRVIRETKPDVIIARFSSEAGYTHGHHTAATLLAMEAFNAAADPEAFSDSLGDLEPWQATRLVWNVSTWSFRNRGIEFLSDPYLGIEVGLFDFARGQSYPQIAALSRSQHQSQGFGTIPNLNSVTEYFEILDGKPLGDDIFSEVDTSFRRLTHDPAYGELTKDVLDEFDNEKPWQSVGALLKIRETLLSMEPTFWRDKKLEEVEELILASLGLEAQLNAPDQFLSQGTSSTLDFKIVHRSPIPVSLKSVQVSEEVISTSTKLEPFTVFESGIDLNVPSTKSISQPYWLVDESTLGQFQVSNSELIGKPLNPPSIEGIIEVEIENTTLSFVIPAKHRFRDPVKGKVVEPVKISPPVAVSIGQDLVLAADQEEQILNVTVRSAVDNMAGRLEIELNGSWKSNFKSQALEFAKAGEEQIVSVKVSPPETSGESILRARFVTENGQRFERGLDVLEYDHIPPITLFPKAQMRLVRLNAKIAGSNIGYLPGAGDVIPDSLRLLGYQVTEFDPAKPATTELDSYDAIVLGIRAINVHENIDGWLDRLFEYSNSGGTVIIQYNTNRSLKSDRFTSDVFQLSRDRVTDETATMKILAADHPVLNLPNKIEEKDFENWVQERGLYFADQWGPDWTPIFASNDSGEPARNGSMLIKQNGYGWIVYTGISFFRQLPAGVPGAYRLFANLVSLSNVEK